MVFGMIPRGTSEYMVPEALPSDIRLSEAPPPDRTSNPPLETTTVLTPSCEPLGIPARLTSGASLARSPPIWVDAFAATATIWRNFSTSPTLPSSLHGPQSLLLIGCRTLLLEPNRPPTLAASASRFRLVPFLWLQRRLHPRRCRCARAAPRRFPVRRPLSELAPGRLPMTSTP